MLAIKYFTGGEKSPCELIKTKYYIYNGTIIIIKLEIHGKIYSIL